MTFIMQEKLSLKSFSTEKSLKIKNKKKPSEIVFLFFSFINLLSATYTVCEDAE